MSRTALKIVVLRGTQKGEEFHLSKRITRLGSDGGCEIQIQGEGIPGHALSIDAGGEEILIYNRGDAAVTVSGASVGPEGSGVWKQGKDLILPGAVQLRLEAHTAKAAATPQRYELEKYEEPPPEAETPGQKPTGKKGAAVKAAVAKSAQGNKKNNTGAILFIAACGLLVVLMIAKKVGGDMSGPSKPGAEVVTWETVWTELNAEKRLEDPEYDALRRDFQHLYRLQNNQGSLEIPRWKSRVLQTLIAADSDQTREGESGDKELYDKLRSFVNQM